MSEEKKMYTTVKLLMLGTVFIFIFRLFDNVAFCSPPPFKTNPFDIPVSFRTVSRNYHMQFTHTIFTSPVYNVFIAKKYRRLVQIGMK